MVNELKNQLSLDYTTSVLAFVNCLIDSYEDVGERAEIRNEFIGLSINYRFVFHNNKLSNLRNYIIPFYTWDLKWMLDKVVKDMTKWIV